MELGVKKLFQNKKQLLYVICIAFLCLIDQRKGSVTGSMQYFWSNCTGLVIAALIFSHYPIRDFLKKSYAVWLAVSVLGIGGVWIARQSGVSFPWVDIQLYSALANVCVYGFLIIRTVTDLRSKGLKQRRFWWPGFVCMLLLFMGLSRNDSLWPWYFLMVFGTWLFTDFSEREKRNLAFGLTDGLIVGFICIQGAAFVFRPYDIVRYLGMYANPNINCLFYSMVYCAILTRLCFFLFEYEGKCKRTLVAVFMFGAGAMWSFCMMTGCRSAFLSMGAVTCLTGISCLMRFKEKVILKGAAMIAGLLCCMVISLPVVYGAIRYIPAVFHHPVWFYAEYSENKVHSYDPFDSQKYITFEQTMEYILGRFLGIDITDKPEESETPLVGKNVAYSLICSTSDGISVQENKVYLLAEETENTGLMRYHIYKYYLSKLNMVGHLESENGVDVTIEEYAPHAHNLYLQQAFDFGVPIGLLFIGYVLWSILRLGKGAIIINRSYALCPLLLFVNGCVFGMLEMMWKNGYLAFTIMFLVAAFGMGINKKCE